MNLGALVDLGVPAKHLDIELKKLKLDGYILEFKKGHKKGILGTKANVSLSQEASQKDVKQNSGHRNFDDIKKIIDKSDLDKDVKALSLEIFLKVAEAEARVHGKTIQEVHFHEVGAIDSIIDIVGAAICIHYLHPDKIMASSIELGGGFAECEHGTFPVPAPATSEILRDIPVKSGAVKFETTTPTGAAILATVVNEFSDQIHFKIEKTAYGLGTKDFKIPNVLRVYWGEQVQDDNSQTESHPALILECNIDDMNPEMYGYIMDLLFEKGADDVFITPIMMKKARPASKISVLCSKENEPGLTEILLTHTTSLGVRKHLVEKTALKREYSKVETRFGSITIKSAIYKGKRIKYKPEYDECVKIAKEKNIPVSRIYEEVNRLIANLGDDDGQ